MGLRGEAASEVAVWACGAAAAGGGGGGECGGVGLFSSPLCVLSLASFFAEEGEPSQKRCVCALRAGQTNRELDRRAFILFREFFLCQK